MRKILILVFIIVVAFGGYLFWQKSKASQTPTPIDQTAPITTQTFVSADGLTTFNYPSNISVSQENNIIDLSHQINYSNYPACDFKGTGARSPKLTDFHVTIQLLNLTVASSAEVVDPSMATSSNISNDVFKLSPGFIDTYNMGSYNGYMVTESVEGCGMITYYLPISSSRTLVIRKDLVGALSDVADPIEKEQILAVPGAISKEQSDTIFNSVVQSLNVR